MPKRLLILVLAAAAIAALCVYKLTRTERTISTAPLVPRRQAPVFDLFDSASPPNRVRLATYLGRHPIVVVFFDGELGADHDPRLQRLARAAERIEAEGIKVFAISGALPPQNRKALERMKQQHLETPFVLLTDPPPTEGAERMGYLVHRAWGRYDERTGRPLPGIFLVDRAGRVAWGEAGPVPIEPDDPALERFLDGQ